jgi:hypothetical protein
MIHTMEGLLLWLGTAPAMARVFIAIGVLLWVGIMRRMVKHLPTVPALIALAIPVVFGVAVCQWTYPQVITSVERFFAGNWVIGKTHHAGAPWAVLAVLVVIALCELSFLLVIGERAKRIRYFYRKHFSGVIVIILLFWTMKAVLYWQLGRIGIYAPIVPPPINETGPFKGLFSLEYCAGWIWVVYAARNGFDR